MSAPGPGKNRDRRLSGLVIGVVFGVMCGNLVVRMLLGLGIGNRLWHRPSLSSTVVNAERDDLLWAVTPLLIFAVLAFLVALNASRRKHGCRPIILH